MAGIYIHVPFCSSRCIYCDFYSTTHSKTMRDAYVDALLEEMVERRDELGGEVIKTIYFGGGTPSLLSFKQLERILHTVRATFHIDEEAEITLEVNPDDVTMQTASDWRCLGFNRVSMGVQTFSNSILHLLRRRHTAETVSEAVSHLRHVGIWNITLDLIYGLPGQTLDIWKEDVRQIFELPLKHLSAYALSYEEGTMLTRMRDQHVIQEADEETIRTMYLYLVQQAKEHGFEHYEISNFALPGYYSRHNSSYWSGVPYLGFGPSAHSYDGVSHRRANHADLLAYIKSPGNPPCYIENLMPSQLFEEYLLTRMRTSKGISKNFVLENYGEKVLERLLELAQSHLYRGNLLEEGDILKLSLEGVLISDYIISDLMGAVDD